MKKTTLVEEKKHFVRFLFSKQEVSRTIVFDVELICDICGQSEKYMEHVSLGVYTGLDIIRDPLLNEIINEVEWGYKNNILHVCKSHKEREIEQKIKELKENE